MFCPRCGVNNVNDAKFCRACGEDIGLVALALEHRLRRGPFGVEVVEREKRGKKERKEKPKEPATLAKGLQNIFMGFAWLIIFYVAFFYYGGSFYFWGWLLIPMLASFGEGLGQLVHSQREPRTLAHAADEPEPLPERPRAEELPAPDTSEIIPARLPSVTEETTRKLGVPAGRLREER
jgi:hypothetical protein